MTYQRWIMVLQDVSFVAGNLISTDVSKERSALIVNVLYVLWSLLHYAMHLFQLYVTESRREARLRCAYGSAR